MYLLDIARARRTRYVQRRYTSKCVRTEIESFDIEGVLYCLNISLHNTHVNTKTVTKGHFLYGHGG